MRSIVGVKKKSPNHSGPSQFKPLFPLFMHWNLPNGTLLLNNNFDEFTIVFHVFTGWWLSMDSSDSFLEKLQPLDDIPKLLDRRRRFDRAHKDTSKTLGFLLVMRWKCQLLLNMSKSRTSWPLDLRLKVNVRKSYFVKDLNSI